MKAFFILLIVFTLSFNSAHGQTLKQNPANNFKGLPNMINAENHGKAAIHYSPNTLTWLKDSSMSYRWDTTANDWTLNDRLIYKYDTKGNNIEYSYAWFMSELDQWYNSFKATYEFDQLNRQIRGINYIWGFMTNDWEYSGKNEATYRSDNLMETNTTFIWDAGTSQWKNSSKTEYSYDANGNTTEYLYYQWDSASANWVKNSKTVYSYDNNNNVTETISSNWLNQAWANSTKTLYEYTANNLTKLTVQVWDDTLQIWVNEYKTESTYDANNRSATSQNYMWNKDTQLWENFWKYSYTYDTDGNMTEDRSWIWDTDKNDWVNGIKTVYFYSQHDIDVGVTDDDASLKISISPNPANDLLFIEGNVSYTKAQIFSFDGQMLLSADLNGVQSINVAKLPDGAYLLQLSSESGKTTKKFIKMK
jgi:hypothetical protein